MLYVALSKMVGQGGFVVSGNTFLYSKENERLKIQHHISSDAHNHPPPHPCAIPSNSGGGREPSWTSCM
jgi:hypothetical protein